MVRIAAIILNFNGIAETRVALQSLLEIRDVALVPMVLDNGSSDDEATRLRAEFPAVDIERSPTNLGFSRGVNYVACRALRAGATHLLLLNSDAWFDDGTKVLSELLRAMDADRELIAAGPTVRNADGSLQSSGYAYSLWWPLSRPIRNARSRVAFISGSCMLIDAERFAELGGFDPDFFLYGEDLDFALRARKRGWRFTVIRQVSVRHIRATSSALYSQQYVYTVLRGNLITVLKHVAWYQVPTAILAYVCASLGLVAVGARAGNFRAVFAVLKAWIDFVRKRWGGLAGEPLTSTERPNRADLHLCGDSVARFV